MLSVVILSAFTVAALIILPALAEIGPARDQDDPPDTAGRPRDQTVILSAA